MSDVAWLVAAADAVVFLGCSLAIGWLMLRLVDAVFVRLGWLTKQRCACCGQPIVPAWAATDEWRDSHYCPTCLWGPLPGRAS